MEDIRFVKKTDAERIYVPMCKGCGLCCVARDWSTEWLGNKVGICGNLNIQTGNCIEDRKKSIICRTYICKDFNEWVTRVSYIMSRDCPTASRLVQETLIRKREQINKEEMDLVQKALNGYIDKEAKISC